MALLLNARKRKLNSLQFSSLAFQNKWNSSSGSVKAGQLMKVTMLTQIFCQRVPKWIRTAQMWSSVFWQSVSAVALLLLHPHPKCAHVTLRHQRLTPRLCVLRKGGTPPPTPSHWSSPPTPAPGSVRICYSRLHFTRFDLEFWSLFLSAFFPLYFFWLSSISYWLFWFMKFSDDECSEKLALQHWWL